MKNHLIALTVLSVAMATPAFANDKESYKTESTVENRDNGGYKTKDTEISKDAAGTETRHETTQDVDVDSKGAKEVTVKNKLVKDPPGLLNKNTVETNDKTTVKDGKTETTHKKIENGHTVEETKENVK